MAQAERWRSVAAASAVVERREASAPRMARAAFVTPAAVTEQRLSAFRFPFLSWSLDERSDIRSRPFNYYPIVPGYRCAHPGYARP